MENKLRKIIIFLITVAIVITISIFHKNIVATNLTNNNLIYYNEENPESNIYLVTDETVSRVMPNTKLVNFVSNFSKDERVKVYYKKDCNFIDEVKDNELVCSGMYLKYELNGKIFNLSVLGDLYAQKEGNLLNGDGEINQIELTKVIRNNVRTDGWIIEDDIEKLSADITMDGIINNEDIKSIITYIETGNIVQKSVKKIVRPNIEIIRGKKNQDEKYLNSVKVKIEDKNQSLDTLKTSYKIIRLTESNYEKIDEREINGQTEIILNEQGKYKIIAYTYGIDGNKSKESSLDLDIIETEKIMTAQIISSPTQFSNLTNTQYEYLEDAIDTIKNKEGEFTIQILSNVENESIVINGENIAIDLNGHEIKNNSSEIATISIKSGTLKIIDSNDDGKIINEDGIALQIEDGILNLGTNDNIIFQKPIISGKDISIVNNGIVNFHDGIIVGNVIGNVLNVTKKLNIVNSKAKPYYTVFDEQVIEMIENITEANKSYYNTVFTNSINVLASNVKFINCIFEQNVDIGKRNSTEENADYSVFSNCIFKQNVNVNSRFLNFMDCKFTSENITSQIGTALNILSDGKDGVYENIKISNANGNGLCYHSFGCSFSNIEIENCAENGIKIENGGGNFTDILVKNNRKNGILLKGIDADKEIVQIQINKLYAVNNGSGEIIDNEKYYGLYAINTKNCNYEVDECLNDIRLEDCEDNSGNIKIKQEYMYLDNKEYKNDINISQYTNNIERKETIKKLWNDQIINIQSNNLNGIEFENVELITNNNCYISCCFKENVKIEQDYSPVFINCRFDKSVENKGQNTEFIACMFNNSVQDKGIKMKIMGSYFLSYANNVWDGLNVTNEASEGEFHNIIIRNINGNGIKYSGSNCKFINMNISSIKENGIFIDSSHSGEFNNIKVFCCNSFYKDNNTFDNENEDPNYAGIKINNSKNISIFNLDTQQNYGLGMKLENTENCNFIVNSIGNSWHFLNKTNKRQYYGIEIDENSRGNDGVLNICASYANTAYKDNQNTANFDGSDKGFIDYSTENNFSIVMTNYADYNKDKTFEYLWFGKYAPERNITKYKDINLVLNNGYLEINNDNIKQFISDDIGSTNNRKIVNKEIIEGNKNELESTAELEIRSNDITSNKGYFVLDAQHTNLYSFAYIRYKLKNGEIYNDFSAQKRYYTLSKENNRNVLYFDIDQNIENIESISLEVFVINNNITIDSNSIKINAECVFTQ